MSNTLGVSKRGVKRVFFFFFPLIEQYHWVLGIRVEKQLLKLLCPAYYVSWEWDREENAGEGGGSVILEP